MHTNNNERKKNSYLVSIC